MGQLIDCLPADALESQRPRSRLLRAAAGALSERPYQQITLAELLGRAEVSQEEFLREFATREQCLLLAYESIGRELLRRVAAAFGAGSSWPEKLRSALELLLEIMAAEPAIVETIAVRVPAAAPEARWRYREMVAGFLPMVAEGREYGERDTLPERIERLAAAGAEAIILEEISAGRTEHLPERLPEILYTILMPYLGPTEATAETRRAAERRP